MLNSNTSFAWQIDAEQKIRNNLSDASLYEQLAEECCELAQACLKKSRKLRDENYTPKTNHELDADILEEFTDVRLVSSILLLMPDQDMYVKKLDRWLKRNNIV